MRFTFLFARTLTLSITLALTATVQAQDSFKLTLLHTNDTHSHHEPQSNGDGGVARQAAVLAQIRAEGGNTLLVDAGDRFTGTLFHQYYQGRDNVKLMNALGYQAMALGNHEFDNGLEVLGKFVAAAQFPVLAANISADDVPELSQVAPSAVVEVGGQKIGLIGLVTAETPEITINFPGKEKLQWRDDYAAIVNAEAQKLSSEGVNKIILLTHIGLGVDESVAAQLQNVDVIVGGHSHTLLSDTYKDAGAHIYPESVEDADGNPVYIVQAGDRTQYLGRLDLQFDADGKVTRARGDTILLSRYITPDPAVQTMLDELAQPINELKQTPVSGNDGQTVISQVMLSNKDCRIGECAIGNLISDALRAETGAQIAIMNGGGIRADINEGPVTIGEVLAVLPFGNTAATLKLSGADVLAALEHGVSRIGAGSGTGRFGQVSGIRYSFDASKEVGSRITSADLQQADGSYVALDPAAQYSIVTNNFMRNGGDGYTMFQHNAIDAYDFGRPVEEILIDYMIANHPVTTQPEGRITVSGK